MVEYYENSALSQSKLKLLLTNPSLFNTVREPEMFYEEKKHFVIGSAVDCLLTTPTEFDDKYHISDLEKKPSDVEMSIINQVFSELIDIGTLRDYPELLENAIIQHDWYGGKPGEKRIQGLLERGEDYFQDLKASVGKQVLSVEEKTLIDSIVMSLKTNDKTAHYFQEIQGLHKYYQLPIYFICEEVECKALLDLVIFNHNHKTIQPIDIKTLGDYTINFPKSVRQRRYDIQAAFYTEALKVRYPGYIVLPFKFIVESTLQPGIPLVYNCNTSLLRMGKYGRKEIIQEGRIESSTHPCIISRIPEIKGFMQLIELYKYYTINGFDLDQVVRENESELIIDWSGIIV